MKGEIYTLYKLSNEGSIAGYPFLAVNEKLTYVIFFDQGHFCFEDVNDEILGWIRDDYTADSHLFLYHQKVFEEYLFGKYGEDVYFFIGHTPIIQNDIASIIIGMGQGINRYRELKFSNESIPTQSQEDLYLQDFADLKNKLSEIVAFKEYLFSRPQ